MYSLFTGTWAYDWGAYKWEGSEALVYSTDQRTLSAYE